MITRIALGCFAPAIVVGALYADATEMTAYYTKINSGEDFERYSRTGDYADIAVELNQGTLVFWRGSSYLPYWQTANGKWYVEELVPRKGDGPPERPDRVNTYSRVAIIESTRERAILYWRYLPEFAGDNPQSGVDSTKFVEEYFTVTADGKVTRIVRVGMRKIDAWRDPNNQASQTFTLAADGIRDVATIPASQTVVSSREQGAMVKKELPGNPVAWWRFDEAEGDITKEIVGGVESSIAGHKSLWKAGVSGTALQFDGYNTEIRLPAEAAPKPQAGLTIEAWVAIGAYPWNWVPIVQQADDSPEEVVATKGDYSDEFTFVLSPEDDRGYFFGIDGYGQLGLKLRAGDKWEELVADEVMERSRWYHVAGTYDAKSGEMSLYVNGAKVGQKQIAGGPIELSAKDLRIGQGKPRRPIRPVRVNTFSAPYSIDGLLDEVRIHDKALAPQDIAEIFNSLRLDETTALPLESRSLPTPRSREKFGAYYDHLQFYEIWDNLWRFGDYPDIVVEFDETPTKFVFWRGTSFIPMIVNEKEQWYSNEFNETWETSGGQGCQEPMSDKESFTNHARIIENTDARVVVHWRYPLVDVLRVQANYDPKTGWGDWSDWYFYIYPDGIAVKTMQLWTHGERNHEWQESMAILGPNQHPEDVIQTQPALVLADLDGSIDSYDWSNGPPANVNYADKVIHLVNYIAEYSPFTIGEFTGGDVYSGEVTEYSVFPTWNHWPVSQMPSDGRYATYPDRTAHSSLTHLYLPTFEEDYGDRPFEVRLLMEGMTSKSAEELVPLARSWLQPAKLTIKSGAETGSYDPGQRAYILTATANTIKSEIEASESRPVFNPCFVVKNWGNADALVTINGKEVPLGKNLRIGHPNTVKTHDLVIWVRLESTSPVDLSITKIPIAENSPSASP